MSFELIIRVKKLEERVAELEKQNVILTERLQAIEERKKPGPKPKDG